jgi:hypothetical protein
VVDLAAEATIPPSGKSTTDVAPINVIWKHEMYFRMLLRKCLYIYLKECVKQVLIPRRCPGILAALKPENMHLSYTSLEIAVLATIEAIRLIIQIPLRTER